MKEGYFCFFYERRGIETIGHPAQTEDVALLERVMQQLQGPAIDEEDERIQAQYGTVLKKQAE